MLRNSSPSTTNIKQLVIEFKVARISASDEPRIGRSIEEATSEMIEKINKVFRQTVKKK